MSRGRGALALLAGLALVIAGCGSGNSASTDTKGSGASVPTTPAPPVAGAPTGAVISAGSTPKLGRVIVESKGHTLYAFQADKGTVSSCYGSCEKVWPALLSKGKPQAGEGAGAAKLGTSVRKDGAAQVTYAGHPLYTYVADKKPGDTSGNRYSSFGAQWHALKPNGEAAGG